MMGYELTAATKEDYSAIARLTLESKGAISRMLDNLAGSEEEKLKAARDYFTWKFDQNMRRQNQDVLWVVKKEGKVVGVQGCLPVQLKIRNNYYDASVGANLYVRDEDRKPQVSFPLIMKWRESTPIVFTHPTAVGVTEIYKKLGDRVWQVPTYVRVLRGSAFSKIVKPAFLGALLGKVLGWLCVPRIRGSSLSIAAVTRFDATLDAFWEKIAGEFHFIVKRDARYLNWKYFDVQPAVDYTCFVARKHERIVGYLIVREEEKQFKQGLISDVLVDPKDTSTLKALLSHALHHFKEQGCEIAVMPMFYGPFRRILLRKGFLNSGKFGILTLGGSLPGDINENEMYIMGTDGDGT